MNFTQLSKLVLLASLWGASFLFIRVAVPHFGPLPLAAVRSVIATLTLLPILYLSGGSALFRQHWRHLAVIALISTAIPATCLSISTQLTSAGFASILNAMTPMFSALLGWLWMGEALTAAVILGVMLGFTGVSVLLFDRDTLDSGFALLPILVGMTAASLYAFTGLYTRRFTPGLPAIVIATGSQGFSALFLLPFTAFLWPEVPIPAQAWLSIGLLGVFCTGFAFIIFFHLLETVGVVRTVIVTYLIPMFAMLWGYLFIGESITPQMAAGALCILAGIGLITHRRAAA